MSHHSLVFEPTVEGHVREWLVHLVRHAATHPDCGRVSFLVAPELVFELEREVLSTARRRLQIVALSAADFNAATKGPLVRRGLAQWRIMDKYLTALDAETGHFLALDHLSLMLAAGYGFHGRRISGILFRPSVHYHELGPYRPSFFEKLRDRRKDLLYRLMLRNPALQSVLSLDPYFPDYAARHYGTDHVAALPDPVHPAAGKSKVTPRAGIGHGRCRFLLFGAITRRKGILALTEALKLLPQRIANRAHITIAGRFDPELIQIFTRERQDLAGLQPGLSLTVDDRRISNAELSDLVAQSDVVLAPYQRFVGSSGVMLWAAAAGKPLLAQDYGLVGRMVRDNRLGLTVDAEEPGRLAAGLQRFVDGNPYDHFDPDSARAFVAAHQVDAFCSAVFASLEPAFHAIPRMRTMSEATPV